MAVLITGGAGFIGKALAEKFLSEGYEVVVFDRPGFTPSDLPQRFPGKMSYREGDIRDVQTVQSLVTDTGTGDPVIHLAGILTAGCDNDPELALAVNLHGFKHVLDAVKETGKQRVIVLASTISVYGRDLPQPITESMPAEPDGWYGYTKLASEQMGMLYVRRHGLDVRAVRLAAVTGANRVAVGSASLFTSLIAEKAAKGEPYEIEVTPETAYPVVYLSDAVSAIHRLAKAKTAPRRIYNVASGRVVVSEMIEHVKKQIPGAVYTFKPDPVIMDVVSGFREWQIDCTRIAEDLGWRPEFPADRMVDDIIRLTRKK